MVPASGILRILSLLKRAIFCIDWHQKTFSVNLWWVQLYNSWASLFPEPPTNATLTYHQEAGNTVRATCSVSPSRPVAHITWVNRAGETVSNDTDNYLIDDSWLWPWQDQPITQVRSVMNYDDGKVSCHVQHPGVRNLSVRNVIVDETRTGE